MGRLVDIDDVISVVDRHTFESNKLDNDISCILEEVPTVNPRPAELYAVEDCISGQIIFNARGGCYRNKTDAADKITRLVGEKGGTYRIVTYKLSAN